MAALTYRQRVALLKEVLTAAAALFFRMRETEQKLQDQLLSGQIAGAGEAVKLPESLTAEAAALEEKRRAILPAGMSLRRYIATRINRSSQGECLAVLRQMEAELQKLTALHAVNRTLLKEKVRYARQLEEIFGSGKKLYDRKGQLRGGPAKVPPNLDRSC